MRNFLPGRSGLLLVLLASVAMAREPSDPVLIRTLKVSDHPAYSTHAIYVAGLVATVLRFEKDVDAANTRLLGWEGKFQPLVVGSNKVVLEPLRDLDREESLSLLVTLVDKTELAFLIKPKSHYDGVWEFDGAYLTRDVTHSTSRPFALRMDHSTLVPGQTGTIVVVADKSAFESKGGELTDLILQIFRGDGRQQVAVVMEPTLLLR